VLETRVDGHWTAIRLWDNAHSTDEHFIDAQNPHQALMTSRALFGGDPVVVVYQDGREVLFTPKPAHGLAGITSSTFKTVPDQPFNTFELTLPTNKFSALAAITNVCKPTKTETVKKKVAVKRHGKRVKVTKKVSKTVAAPLLMPTEMVAQNGAVLKQTTKIAVTGCKAAKPAKKKKKHRKAKKKGKRKKK